MNAVPAQLDVATVLSIRMPYPLRARLAFIAGEQGRSESAVVREALTAWIDQELRGEGTNHAN